MTGLTEIINIYKKANEIDFSNYDVEKLVTKLDNKDFDFLKSRFKYGPNKPEDSDIFNSDYFSYNAGIITPLDEQIMLKEPRFLKPFILLRFYFFYLAKNSEGFTHENEIRKTIGRPLTDLGISKNDTLFYNISRTYWTLKAQLHHIFINESENIVNNDEVRFSNATQLLVELDLSLGSFFFPSNPLNNPELVKTMSAQDIEEIKSMQIPDSYRLQKTQEVLRMVGMYSDDEIKLIIKQNPRFHNPDSGCFIATAVFDSSTAIEVLMLRRWRDESLLKTQFGKFMVKVYYIFSPSIAKIIKKNRFLKQTVKTPIKSFIKIIY